MKAHSARREPAIALLRCAACEADDEFAGNINAVVASSTIYCMSRGADTRHKRWPTTASSATMRKNHSLHAFGSHERHSSCMIEVHEIFSSAIAFATVGSGAALAGIWPLQAFDDTHTSARSPLLWLSGRLGCMSARGVWPRTCKFLIEHPRKSQVASFGSKRFITTDPPPRDLQLRSDPPGYALGATTY